MTISFPDKGQVDQKPLSRSSAISEAGPSGVLPPSFEESVGHAVVDFAEPFPEGGDDPPEFTPYNAEHWVSKDGAVISHDHHLNEDGEALYRFLLSQAETPPTLLIHCSGSHEESRPHQVDKTDSQGRRYIETEYRNETITDFDFTIEHQVPPRATQWTVQDAEPAYRGRMSKEVGPPGQTTKAGLDAINSFADWVKVRRLRGLPPWVPKEQLATVPNGAVEQSPVNVPQSSWTLRQWADDYCQSEMIFKEFVYRKVIYGWDLRTLEAAIRQAITSTHYNDRNDITVRFETKNKTVIVRPDMSMSRAISDSWMKCFLMLTLIYPCIWLFQHLHPRGGGRWVVGGSAYALKRWANMPLDGVPGTGTFPEIQETAEGPKILVGEREGRWFKKWEGTIKRSVIGRKADKRVLCQPDEDIINLPATALDGFEESLVAVV